MTRLPIVASALLVSALALSACSLPQTMVTSTAASVAVSATKEHVSAANISRLSSLCSVVQPLAAAAAASTKTATQMLGQFGTAYCGKLLAGVVPATTDSNTENWLMDLYNSLRGTKA